MRNNGERSVEVIGVDMDGDGIAPFVPDRFHRVPGRNDPHYIDRILEICRAERVDAYYALGEEEAIASSERRAEFQAIGVGVITPGSAEMLRIASNKARYHEFFAARGIPHARFQAIRRVAEVEPALRALGYPDQDVFLKPASSKGGRGARLVSPRRPDRPRPDAKASDFPVQSLDAVLASLDDAAFPELIAMEYLPGTYYSVDVLSADGKPYYAVPKIRIQGSASNTTCGEVDLNPDVIRLAGRACAAFGFSYLQNYEMKVDAKGQPFIYDINPRGGTSLILCAAAGANIAYYAVKMALGEEIPRVEIKNHVRMFRAYREYFRIPD
jgi:carbamoyl-phosphate synthase large subunit